MKNMKTIYLTLTTFGLAIIPSLNTAHADAIACIYSNIQTAVTAVKMADAIDIAVLHSEQGRKEFRHRYGVTLPQYM